MKLSEQEMESFVADVMAMFKQRFQDKLGPQANVAMFTYICSESDSGRGVSCYSDGYGTRAFAHVCEHMEALLTTVAATQFLLRKHIPKKEVE